MQADFDPARLERYLIMASEARSNPVIVLTKADTAEDVGQFQLRGRHCGATCPWSR